VSTGGNSQLVNLRQILSETKKNPLLDSVSTEGRSDTIVDADQHPLAKKHSKLNTSSNTASFAY